jgi:hypothetical protein
MKPSIQQETWTLTNLRQHLVEHYATMALNPATLEHARMRVRELEKDPTGLWNGIALEVKQTLDEMKKQSKI